MSLSGGQYQLRCPLRDWEGPKLNKGLLNVFLKYQFSRRLCIDRRVEYHPRVREDLQLTCVEELLPLDPQEETLHRLMMMKEVDIADYQTSLQDFLKAGLEEVLLPDRVHDLITSVFFAGQNPLICQYILVNLISLKGF